ncbi:MAG: benzoate-CoA ligase family protein [Polyangia bacterium]
MSGNLATSLLDRALQRGLGPRVALREPKRVWSFETLADESGRAGAALASLGVKQGETVALLLHDSMELAAAMLGAIHIGAIAVPVSILLRPVELRDLLVDCGAVAVVASADLTATVDLVRTEVPTLRDVLAVGGARAGQRDYHALVRATEHVPRPADVSGDAPAFVLYSAGAGRGPRGVGHGRAAVESACDAYARDVLALSEDDRVFSTAKLTSAYGLGLGLLFPLARGAASYLLPARPRPRTLFDVMAAFRPTVFAATPSLYAQMVQDHSALSGVKPRCFQTVRHAISGAEGLPARLGERVKESFGVTPLHGFGVTEALHFVLSNRPGQTRAASVGTPLRGVEARLVDDAGRTVAAEEIGMLEIRGPTVAGRYYRPSDAHPERTPTLSEDGWLRLGDRFLVDSDGHYFHCGRADELFKVGGRWIAPSEVEQTLLGHPAVWECAVVEGEDDHGLPQPHAYVVTNVGHTPSKMLSTALMEYVKAEIAPYKYPRAIEFVDVLPKGESGQVQRWRLRPARRATGP